MALAPLAVFLSVVLVRLRRHGGQRLGEGPASSVVLSTPSTYVTGEFKVANSWGANSTSVWGTTSTGADFYGPPSGYYWITFDAMKKNKVEVSILDSRSSYAPKYLAVFSISDSLRANIDQVVVGLGSPSSPVATKYFEPLSSGASSVYFDADTESNPLPSTTMALDITEFGSLITTNDLYLGVHDCGSSGAELGSIKALSVEQYSSYVPSSPSPSQILQSDSTLPASTSHGRWTYVYVHTSGNLTAAPRAQSLSSTVGRLASTRFLTEAEWARMRQVLRKPVALSSGAPRTAAQVTSVDLSADAAFSPIGEQSSEGSCCAFSFAYYIKTYQAAKVEGWIYTGQSSMAWYGTPSVPAQIMSPAFTYNLTNGGVDNGSSVYGNTEILVNLGCASWSTMPYYGGAENAPTTFSTWPGQSAFLEALLQSGTPISIAVCAEKFPKLDPTNYFWDSKNYVLQQTDSLNHENTIVGYQLLTSEP